MFTGKRVYKDRLSNIIKAYPEVSAIWWISILITAVVVPLAIVLKGHVYMPLFTLFVALAIGYHASHEQSIFVSCGIKTDPNGQWTGQDFKTYNTAGIQYALVGPQNLFADARCGVGYPVAPN
ncbi:hypothetical protein DFH08DRAFT_1033725 [Mycena albidolilacea]|uniref:Uncharacterized protein n=1 Tax=Mycena albidolilacea TaxID=1033008 RepID=A0AAD6ZGR7_9AGAR|nr:hypothetical protein DFH08DRAFT_1033725 [Mycena albidolilacea]